MLSRNDLPEILYRTLKDIGGRGSIIEVCKYIWDHYQNDLLRSGDLFYTWQYDVRWAATELRKSGRMKNANISPVGIWEIA